jgi:S1-C subfamily serine protease
MTKRVLLAPLLVLSLLLSTGFSQTSDSKTALGQPAPGNSPSQSSPSASTGAALTNQDVLDLLSAGISEDIVIEKIRTAAATNFDTSLAGLKALKSGGVTDKVVKAMLQPSSQGQNKRVTDQLTTAYKDLENSVVTVWSETGHGSGFIFSADGLIMTNQHVVATSEYIAVQFDAEHKIPAILLASDAKKDVAVLWADVTAFQNARPAELAKKDELEPPVVEGEKVFTIGSPLHQRKVITTGIVSKVEKEAIISDININHGNSGGPLFNSLGKVAGITTFGDFTGQGGPGIAGIVRIEEAAQVIADANKARAKLKLPTKTLLPVEPVDLYPIDAIKAALEVDKFDYKPYGFSAGDFDITIVTPILRYYVEESSRVRASREKDKRHRKSAEAVQGTFRPLDDLRNWNQYIGEYAPVIYVRATPKLRETGGSIFLRSMAAAGGAYNVPAKMRFKTDFYKMRLKCAGHEIEPIEPGKIAHVVDLKTGLVNATDATYEGFYVYPANAINPSCAGVTLELMSEKNPNTATIKTLNEKTVTKVWADFEPYRKTSVSGTTAH